MVDLQLPKKRTMIDQASIWKRGLSLLIDFIIIQYVILGPFTKIFESMIPSDPAKIFSYISNNPDIANQLTTIFLILLGLVYIYFVAFDLKLNQTPGKMLLKLYLSPIEKKEKISLSNILIRNIIIVLFFVLFPISIAYVIYDIYKLNTTGISFTDSISKTKITEEISL